MPFPRGNFLPFHHERKIPTFPSCEEVWRGRRQFGKAPWCDNCLEQNIPAPFLIQKLFFDVTILIGYSYCYLAFAFMRQTFRHLCAFKSQFWGQLQDQMAITYVIIKSIVNHDHDHYYHSDRNIIFRIIAVQPVAILGSQVPGESPVVTNYDELQ